MSFSADLGFFFAFIFEGIYNFFRWTPCGPRKCRLDERLENKACVITGTTSGIGRATAKILASKGAKVIMACRDVKRGKAVCEDIQKECPTARVECRYCDLASFASIRQFVADIESEPHIDILINNAAVMMLPFNKTVDGFEVHFGNNYLGHFMLTMLLLNKLKNAPQARVINLTAASYARSAPDGIFFDDINHQKETTRYAPHLAYCRSKLAMILFTRELAKRLQGTNVHVYAAYPGLCNTDLSRHITGFSGFLWKVQGWFILKSAELGAQTVLFCATDGGTGRESGHYYSDCKLVADKSLKPIATNDEAAQRLWELSKTYCGINSTTL